MAELKIGDSAPPFSGDSQVGPVSLAAYAGRTVVLYFYPRDNTPGCTTEACSFQENLASLSAAGAVVIGVSADGVASHGKFAEKFGLQFPLLADEDRQVIQAYGAWGERSMYGRKFMGILRRTVVIGPDGTVRAIFPKVSPAKHAAEIIKLLAEG